MVYLRLMAAGEELHRPLLVPCHSCDSGVNAQSEDQSRVDTASSQSLHLQCINTSWHVAMWAMAVSLNFTCQPSHASHIILQRLKLGWVAESIQNNLLHRLRTSFYCISNILFHRDLVCACLPAESEMFTYLKVVLPRGYCSQLLILECSVSPTTRITAGSAVLRLPPISASLSPHYVV